MEVDIQKLKKELETVQRRRKHLVSRLEEVDKVEDGLRKEISDHQARAATLEAQCQKLLKKVSFSEIAAMSENEKSLLSFKVAENLHSVRQ